MKKSIQGIQVADRLNDVEEYYFSTKLRQIREMVAGGRAILNLGIGNPDLPPHEDVVAGLQVSSISKGPAKNLIKQRID